MKHIQTEIILPASPQHVWEVLQDVEQYSTWNPFITRLKGVFKERERLEVNIQPPGGSAMKFKPLVLEALAGKSLRWKGILGLPGLFDGEHYFLLEETEGGKTRFVHGERFTGILVPFISLEKTKSGFEAMNESLSKRLISLTR